MALSKGYVDLLKFSGLGLEMGAAVLIGLVAGRALDRWLGTSPWLMVLFLLFGFAAAARAVWRVLRSGFFEDNGKGGG